LPSTAIALGHSIDDIDKIYRDQVPMVMSRWTRRGRTEALAEIAKRIYGNKSFTDAKTGIGVVAAKWLTERPMIFKGSIAQARRMTCETSLRRSSGSSLIEQRR
jgi:hypothetical protein